MFAAIFFAAAFVCCIWIIGCFFKKSSRRVIAIYPQRVHTYVRMPPSRNEPSLTNTNPNTTVVTREAKITHSSRPVHADEPYRVQKSAPPIALAEPL